MAAVKDARYPDSAVFYRDLKRNYPRVVRGSGVWLFDAGGKRYLDACGGAFVANLGHGLGEIASAMAEQASRVAYVNGTAFTHPAAEELAEELAGLNPPGLDKSYFLTSGSEAVEAALKLARQYWAESGEPGKTKILSQSPGYHGNTLLALSASARGHYRKLFDGWLVPVPMVAAPYPYRCPCAGAPSCRTCSGEALEDVLDREGADTVAAFIMEPVGGSSTGASVPRPGFWRTVRGICDRRRVLLVADEVLTGCGRTGRWAAVEHDGVAPDVLILGKGLSGGYAPLSAVCAPRRLLDALAGGSGALKHAQTFSHTPVICAAGLAAVRHIKRHDLVRRAAQTGRILQDRLKALAEHPMVGDVRGIGMLAGVELVADKPSRRPFPRALRAAERVADFALDDGLVVWPAVGQADGERGDLVMIAPPFTITAEEIDELASRLSKALSKTRDAIAAQGGSPR